MFLVHATRSQLLATLPERINHGTTPAAMRAQTAGEDRYNAEEVAARAHLSPTQRITELQQVRGHLLAYLQTLQLATPSRTHPWDTWHGTILEYLLASLGQHEQQYCAGLSITQ